MQGEIALYILILSKTKENYHKYTRHQLPHLLATWVKLLQVFHSGNNYILILSKIEQFRVYSTVEYNFSVH